MDDEEVSDGESEWTQQDTIAGSRGSSLSQAKKDSLKCLFMFSTQSSFSFFTE